MTTQEPADASSALDASEAERLASMIRPAWEIEGDDAEAGPPAGSPDVATSAPIDVPVAVAAAAAVGGAISTAEASAIAAKLSNGTDPGTAPPRDTVIDGMPTYAVGRTDPGQIERTPPPRPAPGALEPPMAAGPTKVGLGEEVAQAVAQVVAAGATTGEPAAPSAAGPSSREANALRRTDVLEVNALPVVSAAQQASARGAAAQLAPVQPQAASFSRADDPIEIPVQKSSKAILFGALGLFALGAIVAGVMLLGGDGETQKSETKSKSDAVTASDAKPAATTTSVATSKATATEQPSAAASAAPSASASAEPSATASATATAEPTSQASAAPVAKADPPKPTSTATNKPGQKPPPPSGTGTKPPKTGGGIIRDTPF